jgi:predicted dehydrogenase
MRADDRTPFRWALAGYGAGGRTFHQPLITSATGLELVAVVTSAPERQDQVRADLPGATPVAALAELAELGVQGVTITTPTATHAPLAHEALALGLHVVVDKPFALTAADARDLVDHAARVGRVITPYQNRRWDSDLLTLKKLIADDALGAVHSFTSIVNRFRPVKGSWHGGTVAEGGGTLLDLGPHLVDQALQLFGPAVAVHARLRTIRPGAGADDVIELHLRHAGGVQSTLSAGMASAAPGPRFLVNGTSGGFVIDGFDVQEAQLKAGESPASLGERWGVEPESAYGRLYTGEADSRTVPSERGRWDTFYPAVARAMAGDGPPPVDPRDAVATAAVLDAARVSSAEQAVVELS